MNRFFKAIRSQRNAAATRQLLRQLDNHILRDIGMPEQPSQPDFYNF